MRWVFGLIFGFAFVTSASAEVPQQLHYSGYLTNTVGDPVDCPDPIQCESPLEITFRLYTQAEDGTPIWTQLETFVPIYQGSFHVILGEESAPLTPELFDGPVWLAIKLEGQVEMSPRQSVVSAAYALRAGTVDYAENAAQLGGMSPEDFASTESLTELQTIINGSDDDTLATLGCTEGQVAIHNAGAWTCIDAPPGPTGPAGPSGSDGAAGTDGATGPTGATGPAGAVSLINSLPEPAGDNCENGGVKIEHGVDVDHNNALDTDEVQGTSYLCNGVDGTSGGPAPGMSTVMHGDYTIRNSADLAGLAGFTEVTGTLYIQNTGSMPDLSGLESLTTIGGSLEIQDTQLKSLEGLSGLTTVTDVFRIHNNSKLESLAGLENLTAAFVFHLDSNNLLLNLNGMGSALTARHFYVQNNESLTSLTGMPSIEFTPDGVLQIANNLMLENVDAVASTTTIPELSLNGNNALQNIDGLSGLSQMTKLTIIGNQQLTNLNGLSNLVSIANRLEISSNDVLTDLSGLSSLTSVGEDLFITGNASLCSDVINSFVADVFVSGDVYVNSNAPFC